jgi:hypothetical protein
VIEARVVYRVRPDATPEAELKALAAVYRFILDCHARKEAVRPDGPDDAAIVRDKKGGESCKATAR